MQDRLRDILENYSWRNLPALPGRTNHIKCGVLVPLLLGPKPLCFAGLRSAALRNHAGEVCFPGGRVESEDGSMRATALREAHEEMGIKDASILGRLSSMPLYTTDYRLEPFVATLQSAPTQPDGVEITKVIPIDLATIYESEMIPGLPYDHEGTTVFSPIFEIGTDLMYGATAHVFYELLTLMAPALGYDLPPVREGHYRWQDFITPN